VEIIYYPDDSCPNNWTESVIALGNFDGVHRGHAKLLERVNSRAAERGVTAAVLTFDPHPPKVIRPDKAPALLMTTQQKITYLEQSGIHATAIVRFTGGLAQWTPEQFVTSVLVDWLHVAEVWVGSNFLFGHERKGNFSLLRSLGSIYDFRVAKIDPVRYKDFVVSSTRIRRLLSEGYVDEAGSLLGHHYCIDGEVVRGSNRGTHQGFPTANLLTDNEILPPDGVYASTVTIDGVIHAAVTNIGVRPTFEISGDRVVESHLLRFSGDLYGRHVRVAFVKRLREERLFSSSSELKNQIVVDCEEARALFEKMSL
tara:strand:- start:6812 stop:7750 length:939 start_codon:yes stop_codon:yes gene_type:complete